MSSGRRQSIISSATGRFMGSDQFNPRMILLQILAIQSVFYLVFIGSTSFVSVLFGLGIRLQTFFDFSAYKFSDIPGSTVCSMLWITLGAVALLFPRIIERTRKCMDFVITLVSIHFFASWLVVGFPSTLSWWLVWTSGAVGCTVLGEWLCMREERKEIRLGNEEERFPAIEIGKHSGDV